MPKVKKTKKPAKKICKETKEEVKSPVVGEEEETEKESGTLSDGVLDAFDEVAPVDPLLVVEEEEIAITEEDDDDEIDSGDYRPLDEW